MNINREIAGFTANIDNSLRLLILKRSTIGNFYISSDQPALLVVFFGALTFFGSLYQSLPNPDFRLYGLNGIAVHLMAILAIAYIATRVTAKHSLMLQLFIVLLSVWPWIYVSWLLIGSRFYSDYLEFPWKSAFFYGLYNLWVLLVIMNAIDGTVELSKKKFAVVSVILVTFIGIPLHYTARVGFWHRAPERNEQYSETKNINTEFTYYKQMDLVGSALNSFVAEKENSSSNIYFVGFAGDSGQDVFMKEVKYAKSLFDDKFNTSGRSVALINNTKTIESIPMASISNLDLVLRRIGTIINPEKDVLFLYVTSHGFKESGVAVDLGYLELNDLTPQYLKESLDRSGIKYRVIVVSACYSGNFVEPLKNEYSMIVTAAASNKKSFGCSEINDFTYFGRAVLYEQLTHEFNFINAFNNAIESVHDREIHERLEPSDPQIFIGEQIKSQIEMVAQQLEESNRPRSIVSEMNHGRHASVLTH